MCAAPWMSWIGVSAGGPKTAVTPDVLVRVHEPVPEHAPVQPANSEPAFADALSVTLAGAGKDALQVPGQLMPAGELVTVPSPTTATEIYTLHIVGSVRCV